MQVPVRVRIKYRNQNGVFNFVGAHYRLVNSRGNVIASGKTDLNGITAKSAKAYEGTRVYLEMMNKVTGEWVSPHRSTRQSFKANKNAPRFSIIVTNCYFAVRLLTTNNVPLVNWFYVITFKDATGRKFTESGRTDDAGITKYISPDTLDRTYKIDIFNFIAKGHTRAAEVKFYPPVNGASPKIFWPVLIPVGSDKAYRTPDKLALTTDTTKQITNDSVVQLRESGEHRKIILDINVTAGASYTIEREDKGSLYDSSLYKSTKITFQDGRKREIGVPKNYYGRLLLKKGNILIATFPLKGLDPNKRNKPIVFCLSNKSTAVAKQNISPNDIDKTDLMMWHFQTKESLSEGLYEFNRSNKGSTSDLKKIANTIFASIAFDGVVLPTVGEVQNALKANNRNFIYDALKKLKVGDKQDILRFYIKKSKTGANMIVFKGYSGLRSFITGTRYGIDNLKVGMIASSSSVYAAASSAGIGSAARTTASTAGKSLGGIGFGIVAFFEVFEWWTTDDPLHNWSDLWIGLGGSAVKAVIATAAGVAIGGLAIAATAAATPAIFIIGIGALTVIGVSFGLEVLDRKFAITDKAKDYVNALGF